MENSVFPGNRTLLISAGTLIILSLGTGSGQSFELGAQEQDDDLPPVADTLYIPDSLAVADTLFALDSLAVADTMQAEPADTAWFDDGKITSLPFGFPLESEFIPGNVKILSREDIEKTGAQTFGELLLWLEDSEILDGGFVLDQQYLSLSGCLPHEVVVLIDGVRANEPSTGLMDLRDVPVESIYRIELLQGPMATLVASEATGGVLNIITSRHPGGVAVSRISILDGDGGLTLVQGSFSREMPKNGFMHLTAASTSIQGLAEIVPSDNIQVSSRMGLDVRGFRLEGWVRRSSVDRENQDGTVLGSHERFTYGITFKHSAGTNTLFRGAISRTVHQFSGDFDFPIIDGSESGRTSIDLSFLKQLGEKQLIKGGFEWERLRAEYRGGGRDRVLRGSVYSIGSFTPSEILILQAGGRFDFIVNGGTGGGSRATGGFSMGYTGSRLVRPYLALSEGNYIFQMPGSMGAESSSWSVEGGVDILPADMLRLRTSYRVRDFDPRYALFQQGAGQDTVSLETIGRMSSRCSFRTILRFLPSSFLSFGFGYTRSEFDEEWSPLFPSETVFSFSTNLRKELKGENLIFEGSARVTRFYEGEMNLLDVKAGIRIVDLVIFFTGRNMLDNRFEPLPGFSPQGRYAKWGFYWNFLE